MEENRKGSTLYVVLGVATLVVAIIGATFAFFSASVNAGGDKIQGGTSSVGGALSINVDRVLFGAESDETGEAYKNLVPAQLTVSNEGVAKAVNKKCEASGYTGCHLYKITATSSQDLASADILLHSFKVEGAVDVAAWKFIVFTGTETTDEESKTTTYSVTNIVTGETAESFNGNAKNVPTVEVPSVGYNINKEVTFNEGTKVYYLLIYLESNGFIQNPSEENNEHKATGTYSGSVAFNAAGGKVVANFNASV